VLNQHKQAMRTELPTGTVTFLFTDIEGSTRLLHALGPDAYAEALAEHRRALREAFTAHGGVEVDTQGDAFFVAFPTATGAAAAARSSHEALAGGPLRVRIGLHTGQPTATGEGYVGADVHRGARIAALAHGGQTLLSPATASLLDGEPLLDLGLHRLKDFDGAIRLHQLGGEPFPPIRTPGSVDLPTPATCFLGRERELHEAVTLVFEHDPRVLTILGPGGTGKTRFALELARLLAEDADGGTLFVPLAPLRDPTLLVPAIAQPLGCSPEPAAFAARIGERRTHVLLDNLEQLLPGAARPLAEVVAAAPSLRLLVTSREPLRIAGETEVDLPPLDAEDAVALFVERARAMRPGPETSTAVDDLCARLDRLPLAIELAAAQTKLLSVEQVLERVETALDSLRGTRDADPRHATLGATIAWSYDLLPEHERELFLALAVFRSGWTLEAAETVCDADVEGLAALLDKSLIRRRDEADGSVRFWMLETIREFAARRLQEQPALATRFRRRHAERILALARASHMSSEERGVKQPDHGPVLREREEIRAALDWAAGGEPALAAEIVGALEQYWVTNALVEGRRRVERLLDASADELPLESRARLLRVLGGVVAVVGDRERSERCYQEALDLFRTLGDDWSAVALLARFAVHAGSGDPAEARKRIAEVRKLNEDVGNPIVEPQLLGTEAEIAYRAGDPEEALRLYRRAYAEATACDFTMWAMWMLEFRQEVEVELGLLEDAEHTGRQALAMAVQLEDDRITRTALVGLALVALQRGDVERAGMLWGAVEAAEQEQPLASLWDGFEDFAAPLATRGDERFRAAAATGAEQAFDRIVALALGEPPQTVR
jgi:predicted ATPase/class 3 adenylate cyclase